MNDHILKLLAASQIDISGLPQTPANSTTLNIILTVVIGIVAAISLLFVTIGGMRYVLSQGDPQAVAKAKSTIIYALVGLILAILAQVIVAFVISRASS